MDLIKMIFDKLSKRLVKPLFLVSGNKNLTYKDKINCQYIDFIPGPIQLLKKRTHCQFQFMINATI